MGYVEVVDRFLGSKKRGDMRFCGDQVIGTPGVKLVGKEDMTGVSEFTQCLE